MAFARRYRYNIFGNLADHDGRSSAGGTNRGCGEQLAQTLFDYFFVKYIKKVVPSGRNNAGYSE